MPSPETTAGCACGAPPRAVCKKLDCLMLRPSASRRSAKDYAVEFGRYLATSAERYQAAVNGYHSARDGDGDQSEEDALAEMTEAYTRLSSDIYEFRKRAERANAEAW